MFVFALPAGCGVFADKAFCPVTPTPTTTTTTLWIYSQLVNLSFWEMKIEGEYFLSHASPVANKEEPRTLKASGPVSLLRHFLYWLCKTEFLVSIYLDTLSCCFRCTCLKWDYLMYVLVWKCFWSAARGLSERDWTETVVCVFAACCCRYNRQWWNPGELFFGGVDEKLKGEGVGTAGSDHGMPMFHSPHKAIKKQR